MVPVKHERRRYNSALRQERARSARERMLRCARTLFVERGYAATTVDDIATAARVGRRSVYDSFGSKRGLLFALLSELAPAEEATFNERLIAAAGDAPRQLQLAVDFMTTLYERGADLLEIVHAAAGADADLAALDAEGERRRRDNQRPTIEEWADRRLLRPGLAADRAADIFWAMTSPTLFRQLVVDCGWSTADYRRWLTKQLRQQLLT